MPSIPRLWDSSVIIGFLAGYREIEWACQQIIQQAERGEAQIAVSEMAKVETAYLAGINDSDSELLIKEFFSRRYIIPISVDDPVSEISRDLIRKHRGLQPPDAIHLATAILWKIPVVETTDPDLLNLDRTEGRPLIQTRRPFYEGTGQLPLGSEETSS